MLMFLCVETLLEKFPNGKSFNVTDTAFFVTVLGVNRDNVLRWGDVTFLNCSKKQTWLSSKLFPVSWPFTDISYCQAFFFIAGVTV